MYHKPSNRNKSANLSFRTCLIMPLLLLVILPAIMSGLLLSDVEPTIAAGTCISGDDLVISEIMYQPIGTSQEWIELYNPTSSPISLENYVLGDDETLPPGELPTAIGNVSVPAGGTVILVDSEGSSDDLVTIDTFITEWGAASVTIIPVDFNFSLDDGGDFIGIWDSIADYISDISSGS